MSALFSAIRRGVFLVLTCEDAEKDKQTVSYEIEIRFGWRKRDAFTTRLPAAVWYGAFDMLRVGDGVSCGALRRYVMSSDRVSATVRERCRHDVDRCPARCRSDVKKELVPPADFLVDRSKNDTQVRCDLRVAVARETIVRDEESECGGLCSGHEYERRSICLHGFPEFRIDFTRVKINDEYEHRIECELLPRRILRGRGDEMSIEQLSDWLANQFCQVVNIVQNAIRNGALRHSNLMQRMRGR